MSVTQAPGTVDAFTKIKDYVYKGEAELSKILPKEVEASRFLRISLHAMRRNAQLLQCTPASILQCLLESARLGLEPTGGMGGAWMVPYRQKDGGYQAQLIVDYRGLIRLAIESGYVQSVEAHLVREGDVFEVERGDRPIFRHVPNFVAEPGKVTAAYAIARYKSGGYSAEVMTLDQIEGIRGRSKAGNSGPWITDWNEMARKTVVRRLCKYVPMGAKVQRAMQIEDDAEDMGIDADAEVLSTKADSVRARIAGRRSAPAVETPSPLDTEPATAVEDAERGVGD
jgi:recombination protein RecT